MKDLLVIYWPTACGKTMLTIEEALKCDGEVVIADSRQIYRGMNIGTGKVTTDEMQWIPHHMLDIRDIDELYGVWDFSPEARRIIDDIHARGKLPILSWWTGLFIDAVTHNFSIPEVPADWDLRNELETFRLEKGNEALWNQLNELDPDYARELDPRNYRYVIRWIEVYKATGESKKNLGQKTESPFHLKYLTPYDGNREALYERINHRVEGMFEAGLVEEVHSLLSIYLPRRTNFTTQEAILAKLPWLNAIGYREILPYLAGEQTLKETIDLVQQNSRHYAKRQLTWFRKYPI